MSPTHARALQGAWTVLVYLLLLAPLGILILASFDDASFFRFPPQGYSLRWYAAALGSTEYRSALGTSALVAVIAATVSVTTGSAAAYALNRFAVPGRAIIETVLLAPLVLPLIVWAIALLQLYALLGISGSLLGLVLAHAIITVPYTVRIMSSTFARIDPALEAAAASLGAPPATVLRRIVLPLATPGLVTSAAFSLLISFNDVIVSSLVAGSRWITFPVRVYAQLRSQGVDPITLAIGAAIIAATLIIVLVGESTLKWSRHL